MENYWNLVKKWWTMKNWMIILSSVTLLLAGYLISCVIKISALEKETSRALSLANSATKIIQEKLSASQQELENTRKVDILTSTTAIETNKVNIDRILENSKIMDQSLKDVKKDTARSLKVVNRNINDLYKQQKEMVKKHNELIKAVLP